MIEEAKNGWISLHRKIQNHWIWKDPLKLKWWIDILLTANHSDGKINIGLQLFECKRGQSVMSLSNWAKRWGVTKDKAREFLVLLEKDGMITRESLGKTTRITVCNYDSYQNNSHDNQTIIKRSPNDNQTQSHPNNNDNNKKEIIYQKEIDFKKTIEPFVAKYGKETCNNFFLYWSEPNKPKTKLRYEMEITWDISRRLANWARNEKNFNGNGKAETKRYEQLG